MLLPYALTTQALSATTANTIQGTKPYFTLNGIKLTNTSELAGFTYPDASVTGGIAKVDTSKSIEVNSSNVVPIPLGVKESDIVAAVGFSNPLAASSLDTLVKTTGYPLKIGDGDGDATTLADIGAKGEISVIMKKDGNIITPSMNALNSCDTPYVIEVKISNSGAPAGVEATTLYGDPNTSQSNYSATIASYRLLTPAMCYLAPESLDVEPSIANTIDGVSYPAHVGYTSLWEEFEGFKVAEMKSTGNLFPQTGFKGAVFTVKGSGSDQSQYECVVSPSSSITQSPTIATATVGKNCTIEYTSVNNPGAGMTISLKYAGTVVGTYTTPTPQLWAKIKSHVRYNTNANSTGTYPAAEQCGLPSGTAGVINQTAAGAYFFSRSELTNARNNNVPLTSFPYIPGENFIRDISVVSPTFMGEWGNLVLNYSNSGFISSGIWSSDSLSPWFQVIADASTGYLTSVKPSFAGGTLCR